MLIYPITSANNKINNRSFQGNTNVKRFFSSDKIKEELNKIQTNKDAKNAFISLSVLAGSILAELTHITEKTPEVKNFADKILNKLGLKDDNDFHQEMTKLISSVLNEEAEETNDYTPLIEANPKRAEFLSVLSDYPNLHKQYEQLLINSLKDPDNTKNKLTLETLEVAFELMTKNNRLQYYESYFETLDKDYCDKLDDVASTILTAYRSNVNPLSYLQMLSSKRITPEEVTKWANAKNLKYDEFLICKFLDGEILTNISNVKEHNNKFKISFMKPFNNYKIPMYTFRLKFKDKTTLREKLKSVTEVHSAIYGPIALNDESDINAQYMDSDIRTELADNILKDKKIDTVYKFVKYINPKAFKDIRLTSEDIQYLTTEDETYKKIKEICSKEIMNLDVENPRLFEIYELMQNNKIFTNIFTTNHAKLRFITRFVLKDDTNPYNLIYRCKAKINILRQELDTSFQNLNIICYSNKRGLAPQFYNYKSKLGEYIKITLNSAGNIHTIYEDYIKKLKNNKMMIDE